MFGGNSNEHYVSCKSAKNVAEAIDIELFEYELVGIDFYDKWFKYEGKLDYLETGNWKESKISEIFDIVKYLKSFDIVFPLIHGYGGEDGKLQGMLDFLGIPYIGAGVLGSAISMDKATTKTIVESLDIPQVPYRILRFHDDFLQDKDFSYPLIVKPSNGGSSIGINKVTNDRELALAIEEARKYDKKVIVEKFITCRELEIAVLKKDGKLVISDPGEIKSAKDFYDYEAKYIDTSSYTIIPDDIPHRVTYMLKEYARLIFDALDIDSFARIDFFYDEAADEIYLNEINTIPGFTSTSMYPKLIENENINYRELITILIDEKLRD